MHDKEFESLECEKRYVFFLLMFVGGFLGRFTYSIRGGVFLQCSNSKFYLYGNGYRKLTVVKSFTLFYSDGSLFAGDSSLRSSS